MDLKEFMDRIQAYYGRYSQGQGPEIVKYLTVFDQVYEDYLEKLFDQVLRSYSSRWKVTPDIAVFEEVKPYVKGSMPSKRRLPEPEDNEDFPPYEEGKKYFEKMREVIRASKERD